MNEQDSLKQLFIVTGEHKRFTEFCDACRRYKYVGICYGLPGIGKTLSARHYAMWDSIEPNLDKPLLASPIPTLNEAQNLTLFYTAPVIASPSRIEKELNYTHVNLATMANSSLKARKRTKEDSFEQMFQKVNLVIVDESDRLKSPGLEQIRDTYDRSGKGMVLIGMPGIEKRLSRFPQFYSRVGFIHQFKALGNLEMRFILEKKWQDLGLILNICNANDNESMAAVIRITRGNFRLIDQLMMQIERLMRINNLKTITKEVVEAARECLIIGR